MSVHSAQVVQSVKLFAGNGIINTNKDLIFADFFGLCSGKKTNKNSSCTRRRVGGVNNSNVQRSFLGLKKNWASIKSVPDIERVNNGLLQQSSDLEPKVGLIPTHSLSIYVCVYVLPFVFLISCNYNGFWNY